MSSHTVLDTREREQQQTWKGTVEAKDVRWSVVHWSCLNKLAHQRIPFWWADTGNFNCNLLLIWHGPSLCISGSVLHIIHLMKNTKKEIKTDTNSMF